MWGLGGTTQPPSTLSIHLGLGPIQAPRFNSYLEHPTPHLTKLYPFLTPWVPRP
jgi:hypothetical protein